VACHHPNRAADVHQNCGAKERRSDGLSGRAERITQKVAWSVFEAHDIMARYKRNAYKDDPTVASELVKFLAINTGTEAIDRVITKVEVMEGEVTTAKREAMTASRGASTASNKVDELKKVVDALAK
jgi:hypothetical protein